MDADELANSAEQSSRFLEARQIAEIDPVEARTVGIVNARPPAAPLGIDPVMFWPFDEVDSQVRALVS